MSVLTYPPVNKAESEIRILTLHPGFPTDPVVCDLETIPLSSSMEYEVVSYAWGFTTLCKEIVVNRCTMLITENAATALVHLRRENSTRRIWIDAICINQLDNGEKAHQVQLMKDIYQGAALVLVWLGPALGGGDSGLDLLEDLSRKTLLAGLNRKGVPTQTFQELPIGPLRELLHILRRPYWRRIWVIQETAIATVNPLVGCGRRWLSWDTWKNGLIQLFAYHTSSVTEYIDVDHKMILRETGLCNRFFDLDWIRAVTRQKRDDEKSRTEHTNLRDILHFSMGKEASDARDRVYAVLGLIQSKSSLCPLESIVPDYSKDVKQVYCEIVNFALKSEKDLDILFFRNHLPHPHFPLWLPDFSSTVKAYPSLNDSRRHNWCASKPTRPEPPGASYRSPMLSDDLRTLLVSGRLVDAIDRTLDLTGIWTDPLAVFLQTRLFALPKIQKIGDRTNLFYVEEALWRTLLGDHSSGNDFPCPSGHRHIFTKLLYQEVLQLSDNSQDATQISTFLLATSKAISCSNNMPHRRTFITRTGKLGWGRLTANQKTLSLFYGRTQCQPFSGHLRASMSSLAVLMFME